MKSKLLPLMLLATLAACRQPAPAPETARAPEPTGSAPAPAPAPDAATPAAAPQVPRAFLCRGNEPFWALDITADRALLKTPDGETPVTGELRASEGGAYSFRGNTDSDPALPVGVLMAPAQCFDTMADGPAMPFSAQAMLADGSEGSGCCTAEYGLDLANAPEFDAATKAGEDWSRHLPALADAIGRCVADAGVVTEAVTAAWPMNQGKAGVRLRDQGQERFDCIVDLGTDKIDDVNRVAEDETMPGEGQPTWLPAGVGPPILHCGRVERQMVGGDAVVGYLHYTDGCP